MVGEKDMNLKSWTKIMGILGICEDCNWLQM